MARRTAPGGSGLAGEEFGRLGEHRPQDGLGLVELVLIEDQRKRLEARGGSLAVLRCPIEMKSKMDVWGSAGDALPLMKSIKGQFDPTGVLNPGRFVGGI